jgi:CopG family nickel-responsive transcriptional regulator
MPGVTRFSVSLEERLLRQFDKLIRSSGYPTRSEAVKAIIRKALIEHKWIEGENVAGTITMVYDHHKRNLVTNLLKIQHDFGKTITASQHVHLDHDHCLEVLVVRGKVAEVKELNFKLKSIKGIKHCELTITSSGKGIA